MRNERRNQTSLGRKRRREFDRSISKLHALGMPDWAVEYYRRAARVAGLPPHIVVCHVAVVAAGRQLQASIAQEDTARPAAGKALPDVPSRVAVSYDGIQTMRRRVTSLWQVIERHGTLRDGDGGALGTLAPEELSSGRMAEKLTLLHTQAENLGSSATRSRRRKASPKKVPQRL